MSGQALSFSPQARGALVSARGVGLPLPVEGGKGYHVDLEPGPGDPRIPLWFQETRVIATPLRGRLRLAGTLELAGLDLGVDPRRVNAVLRAGRAGVAGLADRAVVEVWRGLRPCSPDGLPIVGRSRASRESRSRDGSRHDGADPRADHCAPRRRDRVGRAAERPARAALTRPVLTDPASPRGCRPGRPRARYP